MVKTGPYADKSHLLQIYIIFLNNTTHCTNFANFAGMKAVVDDKIPFIKGEIEKLVDIVEYIPGSEISRKDVYDAEILVVRTRTRCNSNLLDGTSVKQIISATIGFDHIDTAYCKANGIKWTNCPGCNAPSVRQYIHSVLLLLKRERGFNLPDKTIGIVGAGHVGSLIVEDARKLGMNVLVNDPIRQMNEPDGNFVSLEEIADQCDIISFHTPLTTDGPYPTFHLADKHFFEMLRKRPVLMNSGRGSVVDNDMLLKALNEGIVSEAVIDTWENEPHINLELLNKTFIGTPHIAGYSADGKATATRMALQALCRYLGKPFTLDIRAPKLPESQRPTSSDPEEIALQLYNPHRDSDALKKNPEMFEYLRGNYPLRREYAD